MPAPTTSITLFQDRTSTGTPPVYTVINNITATANIDDACFVFQTSGTLVFDHVATPLDIITYPDSQAAAAAASLPYYRLASVTKSFNTVEEAQDFADTVKSRLKSLANEYQVVVATFIGSESTTYTS